MEIDKKREEIRDWLAELLAIARSEGELTKWADGTLDAREILEYLHSQGVAIKVEGNDDTDWAAFIEDEAAAEIVAVLPLIEGK